MEEFGYIPRYSNIRLQNVGNISSATLLDGYALKWNSSTSLWEPVPNNGASFGITGPLSNPTNAIVLFDGTGGNVIKADAEFLYDAVSDTLSVSNIEKAPVASTDLNVTVDVGRDISINGYSGTAAGSVIVSSGNATGTGKNGAVMTLNTTNTVAGSIDLKGGLGTGELAAPFFKLTGPFSGSNGSIVFRTGSKTSGIASGYLSLIAGNAVSTNTAGYVDVRAGSTTGTGTPGGISLLGGSITDAGTTGGGINITGNAVDLLAGNGETSGGDVVVNGGNASYETGAGPYTLNGGTGSKMTIGGATTSANGYFKIEAGIENPPSYLVSGDYGDLSTISCLGATSSDPPQLRVSASTATDAPLTISAGDTIDAAATRGGNLSILSGGGAGEGGSIFFKGTTTENFNIATNGGSIYINSGSSQVSAGNVNFLSGSASNGNGGDINFVTDYGDRVCTTSASNINVIAGTGATDGNLIIDNSTNSFYWPVESSLPSPLSILGVTGISGTDVQLGFFEPDADTLFYLGKQITRWNNFTGLPSGTSSSGSVSVIGTLGTDADKYLQLTPDSTAQSGYLSFDGSTVGDYNTSYYDNWEFRVKFFTNAIAGSYGADGFWLFAQSTTGPTGAGELLTAGVSIFFDVWDSGNRRHRILIYVNNVLQTTIYLGLSIGLAERTLRIRKQGLSMIIEMSGAVGVTSGGNSGSFTRTYTLASETTGHYLGMGARTGGASALFRVSTYEFRQFSDNVPLVRKY